MHISNARSYIMAAMECNDVSRATTLLTEYTAVYPDAGEQLRAEVLEAYEVDLLA